MSIWNLDTIKENTESIDSVLENEIDELASQYTMEGTMEEVDMMIYESAVEMYKCEAALYIADTFIERKALTEGVEAAEVLTENVIKDAAASVVKALKELWGKVRAWFGKAIKFIQDTIGIGKGFAEKHREALLKLNTAEILKNKEIMSFPYSAMTMANAEVAVKKLYSGADKMMSDDLKTKTISVLANDEKYENAEQFSSQLGPIATLEKEAFSTELFKAAGIEGKSLGDVKRDIITVGRGGKTEKERLTAFNMQEAINFVTKNYGDHVKGMKEQQKKLDAKFKSALEIFGGVERKAANGEKIKGFVGSVMSRMKTNVFTVIHTTHAASAAYTEVHKEAYNAYIGTMRAMMSSSKKSSKEDKKEEATKESTLFESIMASL